MPDHFTLDVDPDGLRAVAERVGTLREHLRQKGTAARQVPGEIGDRWTGDAATAIKTEMEGLGALMHQLQTRLQPVAGALRTLAGHYDDALARLPGLNQKWQAAHDDYDAAVRRADSVADTAREDPEADRGDVGRARTRAVEEAGEDRQKALHALELDVGYMKLWLRQETAKLSEALVASQPIGVTDDQIEQWRSGQAPVIDKTALVGGLALMDQRLRLLAEQALEVERAEKREEAQGDVDDLREALEDGDAEAVRAALDAIAGRSDDDIYSEQLVDLLGPDGVQDLYLQIDEGLTDYRLYFEDLWPSIEGFNDTVANGISQRPDDSFADFVEDWMEQDYGPKMWALIAASDQADGRVNAIAMSYHSEVYNQSLSNVGGMPGLYPQAYNYAYGDEDMFDHWDANSSGTDLARVLDHASDDHIADLLFRMHNVQTDGGTMNEGDYRHVAELWGETVQAMITRFEQAQAADEEYDLGPLMAVLGGRHANAGSLPYGDLLAAQVDLEAIVSNPALMNQLLKDINSANGVEPSELKDLIEESGAKMEDVVAQSIQHQLDQGQSAESAAQILGSLLRTEDLLGEDFDWSVVVESLAKSGLSALTDRNPVVGAVAGPVTDLFEAVVGEMQRLHELEEAWNDGAEKTGAQEVIAFNLYVQFHGEPDGFTEFLEQQEQAGSNLEPSQLIQRFVDRMQGGDAGTPAQWDELRLLIETIDETRDEE